LTASRLSAEPCRRHRRDCNADLADACRPERERQVDAARFWRTPYRHAGRGQSRNHRSRCHVADDGRALPPFRWDPERRLRLQAKLDALHFLLYGVVDRDDVRYVYSTFPIIEREETAAWGGCRSRDLCLAWMNALEAGRPDADISA